MKVQYSIKMISYKLQILQVQTPNGKIVRKHFAITMLDKLTGD